MNANICQLFVYDLSSAALCFLFLDLEHLCSLGTRSTYMVARAQVLYYLQDYFFSDTLGFLQTFGLMF